MDALTHGLTSYALTRALFPRATVATQLAAVAAGLAADVDAASVFFGPAAYLEFRRTYFHSLAAAVFIAAVAAALAVLFARRRASGGASGPGSGGAPQSAPRQNPARPRVASPTAALAFAATLGAALLHLALDTCQSQGVALLWPFSPRRFYLDWVAPMDFWILTILAAGILLPWLAALVSDEIGAKSKSPRGRFGARFALAAILLFVCGRAVLHAHAVAALDARLYRGEVPQRIAALPDARSPFRWMGIVETQSALHQAPLNLAVPASFDPDLAFTAFKPEPSPALAAAQETDAARLFLGATRFPKASVERTSTGFRVALRAFPFRSLSSGSLLDLGNPFGRPMAAIIETNSGGQIVSSELEWEGPRVEE